MQPVNLEMLTGLKLVRMTRPKSVHASRLARSTMLSKIHHDLHLSGSLLDQGRLQCCRLCPRTCMGCIHRYRHLLPGSATCSLTTGFSAPHRVAFTLYCVAPTNSEYRVLRSLSTDLPSPLSTVARSPWSRQPLGHSIEKPRTTRDKHAALLAGATLQHHKTYNQPTDTHSRSGSLSSTTSLKQQ